MMTHQPTSQRVLVLTACLGLLQSGLRNVSADEKRPSASQIAASWRHPDAQANSGATGVAEVYGQTFRVPRPFKEVWHFYAKKCGYTSPFPDENQTLALSGGSACIMMHENSTGFGGGISSAFTYRENGTIVNVSLVDRKDGVRVFVSVGAK